MQEIKSYLFCFILESVVVRSEMEVVLRCENDVQFDALTVVDFTTGSPRSKYEHRRASASLRNIQNIRICLGKKPIVPVANEMKGFQ